MSIGAEVAAHLPFLRRYARALTGSQATGDAFVKATLEAALADDELARSLKGGRVPLYGAFNKLWSSAHVEVGEDAAGGSLHETAAQDQLRKITPLNRQALLLTTVEDFSPAEAAQIVIDNDESGAQTLEHQIYMMEEVGKLVDPDDFALDEAAYARTEKALLDQKIIANQPSGAFTTAITDQL